MFQLSLLTRIARSMVHFFFRTTTYHQLLLSKVSANSLPLRCKNGMAVRSFLEKMWTLFLLLFNVGVHLMRISPSKVLYYRLPYINTNVCCWRYRSTCWIRNSGMHWLGAIVGKKRANCSCLTCLNQPSMFLQVKFFPTRANRHQNPSRRHSVYQPVCREKVLHKCFRKIPL